MIEKKRTSETKEGRFSMNDWLALERTVMANERTFLAYINTSLTLVVPGVTGLHLSETLLLTIISALFVPAGFAVFFVGLTRFRKKKLFIRRRGRRYNPRGR